MSALLRRVIEQSPTDYVALVLDGGREKIKRWSIAGGRGQGLLHGAVIEVMTASDTPFNDVPMDKLFPKIFSKPEVIKIDDACFS